MKARDSLAAMSLIVCAMGGCAARTPEDDPPDEAPAEDQPLEVAVDSVDIVHGALRVSATMVDGAADVSVRLGGDCEHREVGGGLSTLSTLVWSLADSEVAEAIGCGLEVRARVRDGQRQVNKVAELGVNVDIAAEDTEGVESGPQLQSVATSAVGVIVVFSGVARGARLTTGDSILEAAPPESQDTDSPDDDTGRFVVPRIDLARSVLSGRPLYLDGSSFATLLSVGGTSLEAAPQPAEEAQEGAQEEPQQEQQANEEEAPEDPSDPE
jgi:hypothetical protein